MSGEPVYQRWCAPPDAVVWSDYSAEAFFDRSRDPLGRTQTPCAATENQLVTVLCGAPGSGKTTVYKQLVDHWEKDAEHAVLKKKGIIGAHLFQSIRTSPKWQDYLSDNNQKLVLLIDGVDEGLLAACQFMDQLIDLVEDAPTDRLRVILTCRTMQWDKAKEQELFKLWSSEQTKVYRLCPLSEDDVIEAAKASSVKPEEFLSFLRSHRLVHLAREPVYLDILVPFFKEREADTIVTSLALYQWQVKTLAISADRDRSDLKTQANRKIEDVVLFQTARRIAALSLLAEKPRIDIHSTHSSGKHLTLEEILGGEENRWEVAGSREREFAENDVKVTLASGLFEKEAQSNLISFRHQTYAEFLAAEYLSEVPARVSETILLTLVDGQRYVVPHLTEVAIWLASMHDGFREKLLDCDPLILLRADLSGAPSGLKQAVVESALEQARDIQRPFPFEWRFDHRYSETLAYDGLGDLLMPVLQNQKEPEEVREWALRMIVDCKLSDCLGALLNLIEDELDASIEKSIAGAIRNLSRLSGEGAVPERWLLRAAKGEVGHHSSDILRSVAVDILLETHGYAVRHVLPFLFSPQHESSLRHFTLLTNTLPKRLGVEDAPVVLNEIGHLRASYQYGSHFNRLVEAGLTVAFEHLKNPSCLAALVSFKAQGILNLDNELRQVWKRLSTSLNDQSRQLYVESVLNDPRLSVDAYNEFFELPISDADLLWLLGSFEQVVAERRAVWARVIRNVTSLDIFRQNEAILESACKRWPELADRFPKGNDGTSIVETWEQGIREQERENEAMRKKYERPPTIESPSPGQVIQTFLSHGRSNDPHQWPEVANSLLSEDVLFDLPNTTAWREYTSSDHEKFKRCAYEFLTQYDGEGRTHQVCLAIGILCDAIPSDHTLHSAIAGKWLQPVMSMLNHGDDEDSLSRWSMFLNEQFPSQILDLFEHESLDSIQFGAYKAFWNDDYTSLLETKLCHSDKPEQALSAGLKFLYKRVPESAERIAVWHLNHLTIDHTDFRVALVHSLLLLGRSTWAPAWEVVSLNPDSLSQALLDNRQIATEFRDDLMNRLSDDQCTLLCEQLNELYPAQNDPSWKSGESRKVQPIDDIIAIRQRTLDSAVARGLVQSVKEIASKAFPGSSRMVRGYTWRAARAAAQLRWHPLSCAEALTLVRRCRHNKKAWLLRSNEELLDALMEALQDYQTQLSSRLYCWVWTKEQKVPRHENDITSYLATFLRDKLPGACINREVESDSYGRTDLLIEMSQGNDRPPLRVIIEHKRAHNPEVRTGLEDQLVRKYMLPNNVDCGIYLVSWFKSTDKRLTSPVGSKLAAKTLPSAKKEVDQLAQWSSDYHGLTIRGFVLDCRP